MEPPKVETPLSDENILKLATDKNFGGSFSGAKNLQIFLWLDYHEHVSLARLYNILRKSPDYLMNLRPVRRFPVRHYQISSFGQLLELDLGFLKPYRQFKYFLVVIDVYSWHIWAKPLVSKTAAVIRKNLGLILDSIDCEITAITTGINITKRIVWKVQDRSWRSGPALRLRRRWRQCKRCCAARRPGS